MSSMKFCPSCQRNVNTEHSWSTGGLVVFFLIGCFTLFIPFLIYVAVKWKRRCPICHSPESFLMAPWFPQQGTTTQGPGMQMGTNYTMSNQPVQTTWTGSQPPQQGRYP